jgi:tetratricopeptide (TPR) repeat protein
MASKQAPDQVSLGMLALFAVTGLVALAIMVSDYVQSNGTDHRARDWLTAAGRCLAIMAGMGLVYAIIHAAQLGPGVNLRNLVYEYYIVLSIVLAALAVVLYRRLPHPANAPRVWRALAYVVGILIVLIIINAVNINVVRADVVYKQGLRYDQQGAWEGAARLYNEAIQVTPNQDFYYLFRGRALMEQAKQEANAQARDNLLAIAEDSLLTARKLNPFNTDHTANLGRLYRMWATVTTDESVRRAKIDLSLQEYERSVRLSPNNVQLWNEWASVYMAVGDQAQALAKLEHSLALDSQFSQTYLLLGDLHLTN